VTLVRRLRDCLAPGSVLTGASALDAYAHGYRCGSGKLAAAVIPRSLVEMWRTLEICLGENAIILMQAANTGLTGGSTPDGEYDRPVVLISTRRLDTIHLLDDGRQVVCLPGATLSGLEKRLAPLGREPHSVIGSSCIGASVIGGICNSSGGALVRRGPAYTELALFARCNAAGELELVDHLGLELPADAGAKLARLDSPEGTLVATGQAERHASSADYEARVRDVAASTPARFNADPGGLFEASGCAGKLAIFAVRLDTFPRDQRRQTYYIGTNDARALGTLRVRALSELKHLPVAAEYIHRRAFDLAARYGKDVFLAIRLLGAERLPALNHVLKVMHRWNDRLGMPKGAFDRLIVRLAAILPDHLPGRLLDFRERYEHHLLLQMADDGIDEIRPLLEDLREQTGADFLVCTEDESAKAFQHRFAVAAAAIRYRSAHPAIGGLAALDVALPRNVDDWFGAIDRREERLVDAAYYGHFFCQVFHLDYLLGQGVDPLAFEHEVLERLDGIGAEYPAEHNVGHCYKAKEALAGFYEALDPCNVFNPGIGGTQRDARMPPA
jgi:D-lactate dehydrogenase